MGQFYDSIPPNLIEWIQKQHIFWVATAPLSQSGHVNLSPKCTRGMFHVVDESKVWYEDMTGSGIETISHIRENGRVTILFTAFEGPPRIVRLFGTGTIHEFGSPEYNALISPEARQPGSRAVIMVDVHKVGSSCGYSIPFFDFKSDRNQLHQWAARREKFDAETDQDINGKPQNSTTGTQVSEKGIRAYWLNNNMASIDGIPGLDTAPNSEMAREKEVWGFSGKRVYKSDKAMVEKSHNRGLGMGGHGVVVDKSFLVGFGMGAVVVGLVGWAQILGRGVVDTYWN
ncbi:hypothetical protein K435DRAFT_785377 [Dendrothele bispora CBS 962.96]|uniref:Pyridoxamine 5'-phosphate oxidase N-terminal domain-containing protein n=1 Tax=Dendrothele bispora (strain CBS 962.96) TaxID=1314807 RepID=A0A4S8KX72_DENBC|nr:hypothetical protein K435DRAFT_785377 [Dendrothele bispora CBS 962.96]